MRYRQKLNLHALQQVLRPVYVPNPVLGVAPHENLNNIPQPVDLMPDLPAEIVKDKLVRADVTKLHAQNIDAPIEKPPFTYWMGDPA